MTTALLEVNSIEKPLPHIQMGPISGHGATYLVLRVYMGSISFPFSGINNTADGLLSEQQQLNDEHHHMDLIRNILACCQARWVNSYPQALRVMHAKT